MADATPETLGAVQSETSRGKREERHLQDYLESFFSTFDKAPFNELDAAALTQLVMARLEDVPPFSGSAPELARSIELGRTLERSAAGCWVGIRDLLMAEHYATMFTGYVGPKVKDALLAIAANPRYRSLEVGLVCSVYDPTRHIQFAATAFRMPRLFTFVAYRGADGSITGWREDFNMAFTHPIPGQEQARRYLETVASQTEGTTLYVGGHSKGGNLALYASATARADIRERIVRIWDLDGPGFRPETLPDELYATVRDRLEKIVPRDSIVGLVLERHEDWRAVSSSAPSLLQHDVFSWKLSGGAEAPSFSNAGDVSSWALFEQGVIHSWLERYSDEELATLVETSFDALRDLASDDELSSIMRDEPSRGIASLIDVVRRTDAASRSQVLRMLRELGDTAVHSAGKSITGGVSSLAHSVATRLPLLGSGPEHEQVAEAPDAGTTSSEG